MDMSPSDMAVRAAKEAIEMAGIMPTQIDAIIYAGVDRDYILGLQQPMWCKTRLVHTTLLL